MAVYEYWMPLYGTDDYRWIGAMFTNSTHRLE